MYKAIVFDLSEVLLTGSYGMHLTLAKRLSTPVTDDDFFIPAMHEFFNGKISEQQYWSEVVRVHSWDIEPAELELMVRENFQEIEGVRPIIKRLKTRGYKLGLLSIHTKEWVSYCEQKFKYHQLFDQLSYSFDVGVSKPKKAAYADILTKLEEKPENCVFIDDSFFNLIAASQLGIKGILFKSPDQLLQELKENQVL